MTTKKAQHTPGSREVELIAGRAEVFADGRSIAVFHGPNAAANARLDAQAPAMYELLRAFVHEFDESDPTRTTWTGNTPAIVEDARAILAAIEGE